MNNRPFIEILTLTTAITSFALPAYGRDPVPRPSLHFTSSNGFHLDNQTIKDFLKHMPNSPCTTPGSDIGCGVRLSNYTRHLSCRSGSSNYIQTFIYRAGSEEQIYVVEGMVDGRKVLEYSAMPVFTASKSDPSRYRDDLHFEADLGLMELDRSKDAETLVAPGIATYRGRQVTADVAQRLERRAIGRAENRFTGKLSLAPYWKENQKKPGEKIRVHPAPMTFVCDEYLDRDNLLKKLAVAPPAKESKHIHLGSGETGDQPVNTEKLWKRITPEVLKKLEEQDAQIEQKRKLGENRANSINS